MNGARRYQAAVRAIRRRLSTATYRDAQAVYRQLRAAAPGPIAARQVNTARPGTLRRELRQARALGSRTAVPTPKQRRAIERAAKSFNKGTIERPDVPAKERQKVYTLADWEKAYQQSTPDEREPIEVETSPDYVREGRRASSSSRRAQRLADAPRERRTVAATARAIETEVEGLTPDDRAAVDATVDELRAARGLRPRRRRRPAK